MAPPFYPPMRAAAETEFAPLPRSFYLPSAGVVAPELLGHWLIRRSPEGLAGGMIVETEAYLENDPASHSFGGQTHRNRSMYGPPGHGYVYYIYGNHFCFNAVCQPPGIAEAVLVRALEPAYGIELLQHRRPVPQLQRLTSGPGKLCEALGIDRAQDGIDLCQPNSALIIAENPDRDRTVQRLGPIVVAPRVGITKAAHLPLRYYFDKSAHVSRRVPRR